MLRLLFAVTVLIAAAMIAGVYFNCNPVIQIGRSSRPGCRGTLVFHRREPSGRTRPQRSCPGSSDRHLFRSGAAGRYRPGQPTSERRADSTFDRALPAYRRRQGQDRPRRRGRHPIADSTSCSCRRQITAGADDRSRPVRRRRGGIHFARTVRPGGTSKTSRRGRSRHRSADGIHRQASLATGASAERKSDLIVIDSDHFNSNEDFVGTELLPVRNDRFELVGALFTFDAKLCASMRKQLPGDHDAA